MTIRVKCDSGGISQAASLVSAGKVIAYPTDTVYAIGCDPFSRVAVDAIYGIKRRDISKQMPILCASAVQAYGMIHADERIRKLGEMFWPGALTIVATLNDDTLRDTMRLQGTLGVRVPAGDCTHDILESCGPLIGTSANVSGGTPATSADALDTLDGIDIILDGGTAQGQTSTIVDMGGTIPNILRKGSISADEINRAWTS